MRTMPTAARVAIATLYIRHRDARRQAARSRRTLGRDSVVTDMHRDKADATWNDLQAVRTNVHDEIDGHRKPMATRQFLDLVARRSKAMPA